MALPVFVLNHRVGLRWRDLARHLEGDSMDSNPGSAPLRKLLNLSVSSLVKIHIEMIHLL